MTTQNPNQNNGHQTNGQTAQPLQPAPTDVEAPKAAAPLTYSAEFLFETAEGFHVLMRGNELTPRDAMVWAKAASKQLAEQGFKPVRRDVHVTTTTAAAAAPGAAAAAGGSGEATWIKGEGGRPPKCSLHGAGVWKEGKIAAGKPRAGEEYAFWACSNRQCRPKGDAT